MVQTDILVIGSGAAGLFYALKTAKACSDKNIIIITKVTPEESNTKYAQGGVAVVLDRVKDNFKNHIEDTLQAGDGICNPKVVEMVVENAPDRIRDLIDFGVAFDLNHKGEYDMGREGGHSHHRVIHHKDNTGEAIELVLLNKLAEYNNITILEYHVALNLILTEDKKKCIGAEVLDLKNTRVKRIYSQVTVLASGGCGSVYETTTNPSINTGDGVALAIQAGVSVSNMQFIQFHPTVVFDQKTKGKLPLITEALRGAGAKLRNINKELFMPDYDAREELAPRDIVSRAIYSEMEKHDSSYVYLDCTTVDQEELITHFPNIYKDCRSRGYDLSTDFIPITPAAHYLCGGIDVDMDGKTSVDNLLAIGECSNTGLHGANRLASNSLLEALVYGYRASKASQKLLKDGILCVKNICSIESDKNKIESCSEEVLEAVRTIRNQLNTIMSKHAGIVRSNAGLERAKEEYEHLESDFNRLSEINQSLDIDTIELKNMLCVCKIIIEQSLSQKVNKGTYYNKDLV